VNHVVVGIIEGSGRLPGDLERGVDGQLTLSCEPGPQVDSGHASTPELALKHVSVAQTLGQGRLDATHELPELDGTCCNLRRFALARYHGVSVKR
jgi:hypothetical protein